MKAIILARVSTEEQKEAGNSLPAQEHRLVTYVTNKLEIKNYKTYSFDESAYKIKREEFSKVLKELTQNKDNEIVAICCDKIDRLVRSFTQDLVTLEELRVQGRIELHFPSDNIVLHKNSPASDLFRFSIGVSLAKYYSDAISDNVKRAIEQKVRKGEWIAKAPYGYKHILLEDGKGDIVLDDYYSKIILKMFEWYGSMAFSMNTIREKLKADFNLEFSKGVVDMILKNPFYYGEMKVKGKLYPHKYPTIITKELYDRVQMIKAGYNKKHFKFAGLSYMYRGLIRCAHDGLSITPEKHKGIIYYHCTQYNGKHGAEWLTEDQITKQLGILFKKLQIPEYVMNQIVESLKSVHYGKIELRDRQIEKLTQERAKYQKRCDAIYVDKIDGCITDSEYDRYYTQFRDKITDIDYKLSLLQEAEDNYYITAKYLLELSNRAYDLFLSSEVEERRQLIKLILQNFRLEGRLLRYDLIKPFDTVLNCADGQSWLPRLDSNQ